MAVHSAGSGASLAAHLHLDQIANPDRGTRQRGQSPLPDGQQGGLSTRNGPGVRCLRFRCYCRQHQALERYYPTLEPQQLPLEPAHTAQSGAAGHAPVPPCSNCNQASVESVESAAGARMLQCQDGACVALPQPARPGGCTPPLNLFSQAKRVSFTELVCKQIDKNCARCMGATWVPLRRGKHLLNERAQAADVGPHLVWAAAERDAPSLHVTGRMLWGRAWQMTDDASSTCREPQHVGREGRQAASSRTQLHATARWALGAFSGQESGTTRPAASTLEGAHS